jgi:hypothetical protein
MNGRYYVTTSIPYVNASPHLGTPSSSSRRTSLPVTTGSWARTPGS